MKYLPSAIGVGQLSGSAGNNTASRNRNGNYIRNRVSPVNPRTASQQARRTTFGSFAQQWKGLTDAQRSGWAALGAQITRPDSLGVPQTLTGLQAYQMINVNLTVIGASTVSSAPTLSAPVALTSITVTATA